MSVRLLLVTYYFPPSGGAGVQRPAKWAKYLPESGVEPVVLTVREGDYPARDATLLRDVEHVRAVRTASLTPFGLYGWATGRTRDEAVAARTGRVGESQALSERLARWVRGNVFVPDARVGWVPFAIAGARRENRSQAFDAILTTGPPHSTHLIGSWLRAAWKIPWIADFRDPWTEIYYAEDLARSRAVHRIDEWMERSVLERADLLLTVSEPLMESMAARSRSPVMVIRNGFDSADFQSEAPKMRRDVFEIVYTGSLFGVPYGFLDALVQIRDRRPRSRIRLRLVGSVPVEMASALNARRLSDITRIEDPVSHDAAIRIMRSAALLLLTIEPEWSYASGVVPGKTYEYLASGRPVLGIGPGGDAAVILRRTGAGTMISPDDVGAIDTFIERHYVAWEAGKPVTGAPRDQIQEYSREAGAEQLGQEIRRLIRSHSNPWPQGAE